MTTQIEIYSIEKTKKGYEVEYSTEYSGVTLDITIAELLQYVEANQLNILDDDSELVPVTTYLADNYFEVVKHFIENL